MLKKYSLIIGMFVGLFILLGLTLWMPTEGPTDLDRWLKKEIQPEGHLQRLPLHDDGRIDFLALLNAKSRHGATVDNNMMVDIFQVSPPMESEEYRAQFSQLLGNPPIYHGKKLETIDEFLERTQKGKMNREQIIDLLATNGIDYCDDEPWNDSAIPGFDRWLEENKEPLDKLVQASQKKKLFFPFLCSDGSRDEFISWSIDYGNQLRVISRQLSFRCYYNIARNRTAEALKDLTAIRRIGSLSKQIPHTLGFLSGIAADGIASHREKILLDQAELSKEQIQYYIQFVSKLQKTPSLFNQIRYGKKYLIYDCLQNIANGKIDAETETPMVNWVTVAEMCKQLIESEAKYLESVKPTAIEATYYSEVPWIQHLYNGDSFSDSSYYKQWIPTASNRTEKYGYDFAANFASAKKQLAIASFSSTAKIRATYLSLKLENYRLENGQYPDTLDSISCLEFRDAKNDLFTGNEIHYKKLSRLPPGKTGYLFHSSGIDGVNNSFDSDGKRLPGTDINDDILRRRIKPILKIDN